jgi:aspartate dehydrogenase
MRQIRVGLIGLGAIGRDVVSCLSARENPPMILVLRRVSSDGEARFSHVQDVASVEALLEMQPDLVVEAAGQAALEQIGPVILDAGVSLVAASAGALVQSTGDGTLGEVLAAKAKASGARLIIPSGAIGGLDYLAAVAALPNTTVIYTSRKPPAAWRDELEQRGQWAEAQSRPTELFRGSVQEAAQLYPRNLNVAATLALVKGTCQSISVRVVVDPEAAGNTHEIEIFSAAGRARFEFINEPSPANPKTSMVTALSVVQSIDAYFTARPTRAA